MNKFALFLISSILFISFWIIITRTHKEQHKDKLRVVCTTTFLADALQHIAGDTIQLTCLMHPGIDPHLYKPTEQDMQLLSQADLIIYHGLHLEGKMAELFKHMNTYVPTVEACRALRDHELRSTDIAMIYDPHVWFSVPHWIKVIQHIAQQLCIYDPSNCNNYQSRAHVYCQELIALHSYMLTKAQSVAREQRILITAHDAFGYFGQTYGFTVLGLQGISTDADISTATVDNLARTIAMHNIPVIFTELSIPHKNIEALQQAVMRYNKKVSIGPELYTDSLGDESTEAYTYVSMMRYTIDTIVEHLLQR
jgi:manganese/zinc/iron transport system substrate-binding protein